MAESSPLPTPARPAGGGRQDRAMRICDPPSPPFSKGGLEGIWMVIL